MTINDTYEKIIELTCQTKYLLNTAKVLCQSWVYNGHKRLYRDYSKMMYCALCKLQEEMFDEHRIIGLIPDVPSIKYAPKDIKTHTKQWFPTMQDIVVRYAELNTVLMQLTGKQSCSMKKVMQYVYKLQEKAHRFLLRCESTGFMEHDMRRYDDELHEKRKAKEKKYDYTRV